jgi:CheY-like chemotaxis protein
MAGERILVVEDNEINMKFIVFMLTSRGYDVRKAINAVEPLGTWRRRQFRGIHEFVPVSFYQERNSKFCAAGHPRITNKSERFHLAGDGSSCINGSY